MLPRQIDRVLSDLVAFSSSQRDINIIITCDLIPPPIRRVHKLAPPPPPQFKDPRPHFVKGHYLLHFAVAAAVFLNYPSGTSAAPAPVPMNRGTTA